MECRNKSLFFTAPTSKLSTFKYFAEVERIIHCLNDKKNELLVHIKNNLVLDNEGRLGFIKNEDDTEGFCVTIDSIEVKKYIILYNFIKQLDDAIDKFNHKTFESESEKMHSYRDLIKNLTFISALVINHHMDVLMIPRNNNKYYTQAASYCGTLAAISLTIVATPLTLTTSIALGLAAGITYGVILEKTELGSDAPRSAFYTDKLFRLLMKIDSEMNQELNLAPCIESESTPRLK